MNHITHIINIADRLERKGLFWGKFANSVLFGLLNYHGPRLRDNEASSEFDALRENLIQNSGLNEVMKAPYGFEPYDPRKAFVSRVEAWEAFWCESNTHSMDDFWDRGQTPQGAALFLADQTPSGDYRARRDQALLEHQTKNDPVLKQLMEIEAAGNTADYEAQAKRALESLPYSLSEIIGTTSLDLKQIEESSGFFARQMGKVDSVGNFKPESHMTLEHALEIAFADEDRAVAIVCSVLDKLFDQRQKLMANPKQQALAYLSYVDIKTLMFEFGIEPLEKHNVARARVMLKAHEEAADDES